MAAERQQQRTLGPYYVISANARLSMQRSPPPPTEQRRTLRSHL